MKNTPTKYQCAQALGLVLLAMRDSSMRNGMKHLDYWRTLDGHIDLDWQEGPHAHEVAEALMKLAADQEDSDILEPQDITGVSYNSLDVNAQAELIICGVRVRLRPLNPVGHEVATERAFANLGKD